MIAILVAAAATQFAFTCVQIEDPHPNSAYVISFERRGSNANLRRIRVIWPIGALSNDHWRGRVTGKGFELVTRRGQMTQILTIKVDARRPAVASLTAVAATPLMTDEDNANCTLVSVATSNGGAS